MPHYTTFDPPTYHGDTDSNDGHRATAHRKWNPARLNDQAEDSFDFVADNDASVSTDTYAVTAFAEDALMFQPLDQQTEDRTADDGMALAEHEVEFDIVSGV